MSKLVISIDVEPDLHSGKYLGITQGLKEAEKILDKHNIKPILFTTCDCIQKNPKLFKEWKNKGWEIWSTFSNIKRRAADAMKG